MFRYFLAHSDPPAANTLIANIPKEEIRVKLSVKSTVKSQAEHIIGSSAKQGWTAFKFNLDTELFLKV